MSTTRQATTIGESAKSHMINEHAPMPESSFAELSVAEASRGRALTRNPMTWRAVGRRRLTALGAILLTTVVWGLSFISTKTLLTDGLTPVQVAFARFSVASVIFLLVHALGSRRADGSARYTRARRTNAPHKGRRCAHCDERDPSRRAVPWGPAGRQALQSTRTFLTAQAVSAERTGPQVVKGFGASATLRMLAGGILGVPVYFMLENGGLRLTSASTASLITGTLPVVNALAVVVLARGRVANSQWAGIAMSCAGIFAIAQADLSQSMSGRAMLGNFLVFLAVCAWIGYTAINKPLLSHYDNLTLNTYQTVVGTGFLLPFVLADGLPVGKWTMDTWLNVLYLGVVCSASAYVLYLYALDHLGSTVVTSCLNLVPVFGVLGGALLLAEPLSIGKAIGGLLALAGAYLVTMGDAAARRSEAEVAGARLPGGSSAPCMGLVSPRADQRE